MQMNSVIICTYNRSRTLGAVMESLAGLAVPPHEKWEIVVVDNNSTDATRQVVEGFTGDSPLEIRYLFEATQGLSHARNAGIKEAKGEILAFTDDDVRVDSQWLVELSACFKRFNCAGVGGKIIAEWGFPRPSWLVTEGPYKLNDVIIQYDLGPEPCEITIRTVPFGANMAFKRSVFERYGSFRTDVGFSGGTLVGGEETELCRRLLQAGEQIMYSPLAIVHHPVDKSRVEKRYFQRWYFGFGRSVRRLYGVPEETVRYFGVPRFLIRSLMEAIGKWVVSVTPRRRFYYKLQVYQLLGEVQESRDSFRRGSAQKI